MSDWADRPLNPPVRLADAIGVSTIAEAVEQDQDASPFAGSTAPPSRRRRFVEADDGAGAFSDVPAIDRRRSRRSNQNVPGWLSPSTGKSGNGRHVRVLDLSLHGVGFECDEPLDTKAAHWFMVSSGALRLSCRLRVVKCEPQGDHYVIGANFF